MRKGSFRASCRQPQARGEEATSQTTPGGGQNTFQKGQAEMAAPQEVAVSPRGTHFVD